MTYETGAGATRTVFGYRYHRLYQNAPSGNTYFQSDIYGSPLFAADGQGAVKQYAERDIWGTLKPGTELLPELEENMRFTTYRYDPVLGKHFALARFYDGANGRMMSKDPVKRGLNPYRYCDNDPVNYEDSTGKILHILGASFLGGLFGAGGAALDSIISQALDGGKIDWKEVGGSAIDGGIIGAAQAGLLASGAGVPAALLVDFLAGTTGSAAKQYYVDGKIDAGESITRGLTNAVGQLPYNDKIFDKLGKLKKLQGAGREAVKGAMAGAGEAGIRYITDHIGSSPAQVRMGTGLLPAIAGNFSPGNLLRDPKGGCGSESPFAPGLGYHSARGYHYDVPRISESRSNKASLGGFLKETALGGLIGGLAGAAFYKLDKGIERFTARVQLRKDGLKPRTLSNVDARKWYLEQEAQIINQIDDSLPLKRQARQAFNLRNQYRTQARELMSDRQLANSLYKTDANRTWRQMLDKQIGNGLSGDDIYKSIIESSQRSRTSVNELLGLG